MNRFATLAVFGALVGLPAAAGEASAQGVQGAPAQMWGHRQMFGPGHPYGHGPMMMGPSGHPHAAETMRRPVIDADGDGIVDAGEAAAEYEAMFRTLDTNGDGALDVDEYVAFGGHGRYSRQEVRAQRFRKMDADADGRVTQAEFVADGKARFDAADADGDGKVTVWEWRSAPRF